MPVRCEVGTAVQGSDVLARVEGAVRVETGVVVVLTEAATAERLRAPAVSRVQGVEGIVRMLTCSILHL